MFLIVFSIILLIANIYCFAKKQYLYLFIPCMLFLPKFYGIEFSINLPLLTVGRMMMLIFYIYVIINHRRSLKDIDFSFKKIPVEYYLLGGYFLLRIISNLYYITTYNQAAKTIFEIVFEQLLFLIAFWFYSPTKEEMHKLIKVVVWASCFMFVVGIIESIFSVRPFDALYTVDRYMLNDHYWRLSLLRSTTTLGLPGFYGNMCILMIPLILYMYECTKQKRYLVVAFLNLLAMIHSGCRSDIFFYGFIMVCYFIFIFRTKERRIEFLKHAGIILSCLLIWMVVFSFLGDNFRYFYTGTAKSVLNEVGFDFDLNQGAPEGTGYGSNGESGTASRTAQLTCIKYAMHKNPVFGLGSGAETNGQLHIYWGNKWKVFKSYDMGIVEVICNEGLIGLIGYGLLFISIFLKIINHRNNLPPHYILFSSPFVYLLCMISTANIPYLLTIITLFIFNTKLYFCSNDT